MARRAQTLRTRTRKPAAYAGRHRDTTAAGITRANIREDIAQRGYVRPGRHGAGVAGP